MKSFKLVPLLLLFTNIGLTNAICHRQSFIIEYGKSIKGAVLERVLVDGLNDCLQRCRQDIRCKAVNFELHNAIQPICALIDTSIIVSTDVGSSIESNTIDPVIYSAESICHQQKIDDQKTNLKGLCAEREWSFEKHSNFDLLNSDLLLEDLGKIERNRCLIECIKRSDQCRSIAYDRLSGECRLASIGPHTVHRLKNHFQSNDRVDLYENNCRDEQLITRKCQYLKVKSAGFTDVFDVRFSDVKNDDDCSIRCLEWKSGTCRSYTFDTKSHMCYLSHSTSRMLDRSPLDIIKKHLSTADLEDCVEFSLQCKRDGMLVSGSAMKLFSGTLKAKHNREYYCERTITNAFTFETQIAYGDCGMQKQMDPSPTYSNVIFLKEGSTELITVRDKLVQVFCRMHENVETVADDMLTMQLAYRLHVDNETEEKINREESPQFIAPKHHRISPSSSSSQIIRAKYQLDVLNDRQHSADIVHVNDTGYLLISVDRDSNRDSILDFEVSDLIAEDKRTQEQIELIDGDGCIKNSTIVLGIDKDAAIGKMRIKIRFAGFDDEAQVAYQALVKPCLIGDCHRRRRQKCGGDHISEPNDTLILASRDRRSPNIQSRRYALVEDLYNVKSIGQIQLASRIDQSISHATTEQSSIKFPELMTLLFSSALAAAAAASSNNTTHHSIGTNNFQQSSPSSSTEIEPIPTPIVRCLAHDVSCLFTVLLASLQCLLMFGCVCVFYFYMQQWRRCRLIRRLIREQQLAAVGNDAAIEYEFTGDRGRLDMNQK